MQEGIKNLEKVGWKVDYVISHCLSSTMQDKLEQHFSCGRYGKTYETDVLTEYFDELEEKLEYKRWYCGHYHLNMDVDEKHTVLYEKIVPLQ